jgi:flagellar biosynthetic protein FliS
VKVVEKNSNPGVEGMEDLGRAGSTDDTGDVSAAVDQLTLEVVNHPAACVAVQGEVSDIAFLDRAAAAGRAGPREAEADAREDRPAASIVRLYDGALTALREARDLLDARALEETRAPLLRAAEIFGELQEALDGEQGRETAERFVMVYLHCRRRIMEAHLQVEAAPLQELVTLLTPLRDAWARIQRPVQVAP